MNDFPTMTEVPKSTFREMYFALGRCQDGWTAEYWDALFEKEKEPPMAFMVKSPESPSHTRMMIVTDYHLHQIRMFFVTLDEEERLFSSYEVPETKRPWWRFWK